MPSFIRLQQMMKNLPQWAPLASFKNRLLMMPKEPIF